MIGRFAGVGVNEYPLEELAAAYSARRRTPAALAATSSVQPGTDQRDDCRLHVGRQLGRSTSP